MRSYRLAVCECGTHIEYTRADVQGSTRDIQTIRCPDCGESVYIKQFYEGYKIKNYQDERKECKDNCPEDHCGKIMTFVDW